MNQTTTSQSGQLQDELRSDASSLAATAKDRIQSEVDARKGTVVQQAQKLSTAINTAAGELGQDGPAWLRSTLEKGAQSIQRLSETVETKDAAELMNEVNAVARKSPGLFLAGCALAGFAAARVVRAGASASGGSGTTGSRNIAIGSTPGTPPSVAMSVPNDAGRAQLAATQGAI